jgi:hypothetical protein
VLPKRLREEIPKEAPPFPEDPKVKPFGGALLLAQDVLYLGGRFTRIDHENASSIARYDLAAGSWHAVSDGLFAKGRDPLLLANEAPGQDRDLCLAGSGSLLIAGGSFQRADDIATAGLAAFDLKTQTWGALGGGLVMDPATLGMSDEDLKKSKLPKFPEVFEVASLSGKDRHQIWVGGAFTGATNLAKDSDSPTTVASRYLACWDVDRQQWIDTGIEASSLIIALTTFDRSFPAVLLGMSRTGGGVVLLHSGKKGKFFQLGEAFSNSTGKQAFISDLLVTKEGIHVGGTFDRYGEEPVGNLVFLRFK